MIVLAGQPVVVEPTLATENGKPIVLVDGVAFVVCEVEE